MLGYGYLFCLMSGRMVVWFERRFLVVVLVVLVFMRTSLGLRGFLVAGDIWICSLLMLILGLSAVGSFLLYLVLSSLSSVLRSGV